MVYRKCRISASLCLVGVLALLWVQRAQGDIILGNLKTSTQVDVYEIYINNPATFSATTSNPGTAPTYDTMLFLFDSSKKAVEANDDAVNRPGSWDPRATLPAGNPHSPTTAGYYFLTLSAFDMIAYDINSVGLFAPEPLGQGISGPKGNAGPLNYFAQGSSGPYAGEVDTGPYEIDLVGATLVPEPRALVLAAVALAGLGLGWLRTRRVRRRYPRSAPFITVRDRSAH